MEVFSGEWVDNVQAHFEILCGVLNQYASRMKGLTCCAEYSYIFIFGMSSMPFHDWNSD